MSQAGSFNAGVPPPGTVVRTLQGDIGAPVSPDGAGNINVITDVANNNAGITVLISGAANTLTFNVTDVDSNTIIGLDSGSLTFTTANNNTSLGVDNLTALTSGSRNIAIGNGALENADTTTDSIAIGRNSLNTAFAGQRNIAIGSGALEAHQSGSQNIAIGFNALNSNVTQATNIAIGDSSQAASITGGSNVSLGENSLLVLTSGSNNVAVGTNSLGQLGTGQRNIALGHGAASSITGASSDNIIIGFNLGAGVFSNTIIIGTDGGGSGQQNRCFIAGIAGVTVANTQMVTIDTTTGQLGSEAIPSGFEWTVVTVNQIGADNQGFFTNAGGVVDVALPASSAVGDTFQVAAMSAGGWTISQGAGQQIRLGNVTTTLGILGSLASTDQGDWVTLVCSVTDTEWMARIEQGNVNVN